MSQPPSLSDDVRAQYAILDTLEEPDNQPRALVDALQMALDSARDHATQHHLHLAALDQAMREGDAVDSAPQVGAACRQAHQLLQVLDAVHQRAEALLHAYHNVLRPNLDIAMANTLAMMARQQQQLQFTYPVEPTTGELPLDIFNLALYPDSLTHRPRAETGVAHQTLSPYK